MAVQVILRTDVPRLGRAGEMVSVADGYARNFLIPQGRAWLATEGALRHAARERALTEARRSRTVAQARAMADQLAKISCTIKKAAGEGGRLFGTVTPADIAQALQAHALTVDKRSIRLAEPIKSLGMYTVTIHLTPEVEAQVKVWVDKA